MPPTACLACGEAAADQPLAGPVCLACGEPGLVRLAEDPHLGGITAALMLLDAEGRIERLSPDAAELIGSGPRAHDELGDALHLHELGEEWPGWLAQQAMRTGEATQWLLVRVAHLAGHDELWLKATPAEDRRHVLLALTAAGTRSAAEHGPRA